MVWGPRWPHGLGCNRGQGVRKRSRRERSCLPNALSVVGACTHCPRVIMTLVFHQRVSAPEWRWGSQAPRVVGKPLTPEFRQSRLDIF